MNIRTMTVALAAITISFGLSAQNINPTVEVTNTYEGRLLEVTKPLFEMAVPDSLLSFRLDFDYDVFDTPYKGAYDFEPYLIGMSPSVSAPLNKFFLKAGLGSDLGPVLGFTFSPTRKRMQWDVYGSMDSGFRSYFTHDLSADATLVSVNPSWKGRDMRGQIGANGRRDWASSILSFGAALNYLSTKDMQLDKTRLGVQTYANFRSAHPAQGSFYYDATLGYSINYDAFAGAEEALPSSLGENHIRLNGEFGPMIGKASRFTIGVDSEMNVYSGVLSSSVGRIAVIPRYIYDHDRWAIRLGLSIGGLFSEDNTAQLLATGTNHSKRGRGIYPMTTVDYTLVPGYLGLYLSATGGDNINTYSAIQEENHFFNPLFSREFSTLLNNTVDKGNFSVGIKGSGFSRLQYKVYAGALFRDNALLETAYKIEDDFLPGVTYRDYRTWYAGISARLDTKTVDAGLDVEYKSTMLMSAVDDFEYGFLPAPLSGNVFVRYNWMDRLTADVGAEFRSSREGGLIIGSVTDFNDVMSFASTKATLPGWVNLGVGAEYRLTRRLGLWLRGENLLGQKVQKNLFYVYKGVVVRGGIIFNL